MRRDSDRFRWLRGSRALDERSRAHLHAFGRQVIFILICSLPTLLIDKQRPILCLVMMRVMFGFSALFLFGAAVLTRHPVSPKSICIWDHFTAMLLLTLACSIALQLLQPT
jgi:hypothetical protein